MSSACSFLSILLLTLAGHIAMATAQKPCLNKDAQIVRVSYCDLVNAPDCYDGKLVRVKATVLTWMDGTLLYDENCGHKGLDWAIDCDDEDERAAMGKSFEENMVYSGNLEGRVEAILIGRLVVLSNTSRSNQRPKLMIKHIEQITQIASDSPWSGQH